MIQLNFKKWLEVFGVAIEPPVQEPEKLNNGACPRYDRPVVSYMQKLKLMPKTKKKDVNQSSSSSSSS